VLSLIEPLQDAVASACVRAEREVNRALGGSCTIPLGAYAVMEGGNAGGKLKLRALVASPDGRRIARAEGEGDAARPEELGLRVAALLRERGAVEILAALGA
jgi:hydroxymethylbilane synthase